MARSSRTRPLQFSSFSSSPDHWPSDLLSPRQQSHRLQPAHERPDAAQPDPAGASVPPAVPVRTGPRPSLHHVGGPGRQRVRGLGLLQENGQAARGRQGELAAATFCVYVFCLLTIAVRSLKKTIFFIIFTFENRPRRTMATHLAHARP